MESRSQARGESALFVLVVAAILVVLNIVSIRVFFRMDLTRNRAHSLSKGSLRVVEGLKDRMTVKAYFTKNLPPPFNTTEQYVRDLLEEYQARSKGKMRVEFIDPSGETKAEEARQAGIREVTHQVIDKDQASEMKGFRGIQFLYMGDSKVIEVVANTMGLEYEITSLVKQLMGDKSTVAFLQGHGEPKTMTPPPEDPYAQDRQQEPAPLEEARKMLAQYNVREVDLEKGASPVPQEAKALMVVGPTEEISDKELYVIDQYLMKGGNAAFFVDGVKVDTSQGWPVVVTNKSGVDRFLEHFGVKVRPDMVFDLQCDTVPIRGPFGMPLATRYPAWPVTKVEGEHPATFKLPALTFPWSSSLQIAAKPAAGNVKIEVLARSSDKSWKEEGNIQLDPTNTDWPKRIENAKARGPFVLAAAVSGKFTSYFDGKGIPGAEGQPDAAKDFVRTGTGEGKLIVAGSSQMILDQITGALARLHSAGDIAANMAFMLNSVDWLTQEQDLIEIRAKGVEEPRIRQVSDSTRALIKYGNIAAWPLLFLVLGLVRWAVRSRASRAGGGASRREEETGADGGKTKEKEHEKEEKQ